MRVTSPAIWMLLGAVIVILAGLLIISSISNLETLLAVEAKVTDGHLSARVPAARAEEVEKGMPIRVAGREINIDYVYDTESGETYCAASLPVRDGLYDAEIVLESVKPISFLLN